jgi:hypothetical protein
MFLLGGYIRRTNTWDKAAISFANGIVLKKKFHCFERLSES